jgi:hypothetical protein
MVRTGKHPVLEVTGLESLRLYAMRQAWHAKRVGMEHRIEDLDAGVKDIDIKQHKARKPGRLTSVPTRNHNTRSGKPPETLPKYCIYHLLNNDIHIAQSALISIKSFWPSPKTRQAHGPVLGLVAGICLALFTVIHHGPQSNAPTVTQPPQLHVPSVLP